MSLGARRLLSAPTRNAMASETDPYSNSFSNSREPLVRINANALQSARDGHVQRLPLSMFRGGNFEAAGTQKIKVRLHCRTGGQARVAKAPPQREIPVAYL